MRKNGVRILLAAICLIVLTASAYAWPSDIDGRPKQFTANGGTPGYYVWQDEYGFHLWTVTGPGNHVFVGEIRSSGRLYDLRGHHLQGGESFYVYQDLQTRYWFEAPNSLDPGRFTESGLEVDYDPHKIEFKFAAGDSANGLRFRTAGGSFVSFSLLMDGREVDRKLVWIGADGWHPDGAVFKFQQWQ